MLRNKIFDSAFIRETLQRLKELSCDNQIYFDEYENSSNDYNLPYCCKLRVRIDGKDFKAWGNGPNKDEAAFKCVAELLERIALKLTKFSKGDKFLPYAGFMKKDRSFHELEKLYSSAKNWLGTTSSGMAVHSNVKRAKEAALNELVERHVILKAIACNISPQKTPPPRLSQNYKLPPNIKQIFYCWKGPFNRNIVLSQIIVSKGKFMYSFGCDVKLEKAKEKAFLESVGMVIYSHDDEGISKAQTVNVDMDLDIDCKIDMDTVRNYHLFCGDNSIVELLNRSSIHPVYIDEQINLKDVYYTEISFPDFLGNVSPLVAIKCISPVMQPLFFDKWKEEVVNPLAISIRSEGLPRGLHVIS